MSESEKERTIRVTATDLEANISHTKTITVTKTLDDKAAQKVLKALRSCALRLIPGDLDAKSEEVSR